MYICSNCFNRKSFRREGTEFGRANYSCNRTEWLDGNGDEVDSDSQNYDYDDEDPTDYEEDLFACNKCGCSDIIEFSSVEELEEELENINKLKEYNTHLDESLNGGI